MPDLFDAIAEQPKKDLFDQIANETRLSPSDELKFQQWKSRVAPTDSGEDYDLRGAFKAGISPDPETGHWPDTFKKPNHPTFSDESIYANQNAGHWDGNTFVPANREEIRATPSILEDVKAGRYTDAALAASRKIAGWTDTVFGSPSDNKAPVAERWNEPSMADLQSSDPYVVAAKRTMPGLQMLSPEMIGQLPFFAVPGVAETYGIGQLAHVPEQIAHLKEEIQKKGLNLETAGDVFDTASQDALAFLPLAARTRALAAARRPTISEALKTEGPTNAETNGTKTETAGGERSPELEPGQEGRVRVRDDEKDRLAAEPGKEAPANQRLVGLSVSPFGLERDRPAGAQTIEEALGLPANKAVTQRFAKPEGAAVPDESQSTANITRQAIEWRKGLIDEGNKLGEQARIVEGIGQRVPKPLADRINEINDELRRGFQPEKATYELRGEPPLEEETQQPKTKLDRIRKALGQEIAVEEPTPNKSLPEDSSQVVPLPSESSEKVASDAQPQTPVEVPRPSESEPNITTGVANRILKEESDAGKIEEIQPGEGLSWEEMVDRGRSLLNKGADPQMIARRFQRNGRISADDFAVVRAERERLAVETAKAEQITRANPNDTVARDAYNYARATETDWVRNVVQPAKTATSDIFRGMQGEAPVDATTFAGLRKAVLDIQGRDVAPNELRVLDETAKKTRQATADATESLQQAATVVENKFRRKAVPKTVDELREHFANRIREITPCT